MGELTSLGPDEHNLRYPGEIEEVDVPEEPEIEEEEEDGDEEYDRSCPSPGIHEIFVEKTGDRLTYRIGISAADDPTWKDKFVVMWSSVVEVLRANGKAIDAEAIADKQKREKDVGVR